MQVAYLQGGMMCFLKVISPWVMVAFMIVVELSWRRIAVAIVVAASMRRRMIADESKKN